jgi:hypothetical protein
MVRARAVSFCGLQAKSRERSARKKKPDPNRNMHIGRGSRFFTISPFSSLLALPSLQQQLNSFGLFAFIVVISTLQV